MGRRSRLASEETAGIQTVVSIRSGAGSPHDPDAEKVRQTILNRWLRHGFLGDGLFADPAWDMLLALYHRQLVGHPVTVNGLCVAVPVSRETTIEWIGRLEQLGHVVRHPDPVSPDQSLIELTPQTSAALRRYFGAISTFTNCA